MPEDKEPTKSDCEEDEEVAQELFHRERFTFLYRISNCVCVDRQISEKISEEPKEATNL